MNKIKLLDCTLRDGGFINDWNFGKSAITNIYSRLAASHVDYIELGFLNDSREFDENRTIMPKTECLNKIFDAKIKTNAKLLAMVIMGECAIDNIGNRSDTLVDGIRVVFKKSGIEKAFEFATACREKGYDVYLQPASITDYSDDDMINLVKKANAFKPCAFYMVDTYGFLDKNKLFHYAKLIDNHLDTDIEMGYHSHNNFQLSYATAIEFIELPKKHDIVIDCTLFGMGKSVGNLNTELIIDYLNNKGIGKYDNYQILEAIDSEIMKIKQGFEWGYSLNGFIAASNSCHPKYVSYLLNKRSLSVGSINKIIAKIDKDKLTTFDKELVDKLYREYQSIDIDDSKVMYQLKQKFENKEVLVMATGSSLDLYKNEIIDYIEKNKPIIISVNHTPKDYKIDYCFINNSKRYSQMSYNLNSDFSYEIIATSNIVSASRQVDFQVNYENLLVDGDPNIVSDNATLMLFKLLSELGVSNIVVTGFDGFAKGKKPYVGDYMTFNVNPDLELQNKLISEAVRKMRESIDIQFLTKSYYEV